MPKLKLARLDGRHEFESTLRRPPLVMSAHFALHYREPMVPARHRRRANGVELSTEPCQQWTVSVDNKVARLGIVVPKRFSRRAVTRSLLKRQIRAAAIRHLDQLRSGIWIVRQRAAFQWVSDGPAASKRLNLTARIELDKMLEIDQAKHCPPAE